MLVFNAADSKSVAGDGVLVQVRPGAPICSGQSLFGKYETAKRWSVALSLAGYDTRVFSCPSGDGRSERGRTRAWSIPKGLYAEGEEPFAAAKREFREETLAGFLRG